jgi:hypothetical protein
MTMNKMYCAKALIEKLNNDVLLTSIAKEIDDVLHYKTLDTFLLHFIFLVVFHNIIKGLSL